MTPVEGTSGIAPGNRAMLPRWQYLALLFVLAFVIRLGLTAALRDLHQFHGPRCCGADAVDFNNLALNLASGKGYTVGGHPTAFRAPGFPFFLSLLYRVSYANYLLVYLSLCAVGAFTCVATYYLARLLLTEKAARLAGILLAVYLPHAYFSSTIMSEATAGLCLTLGPLLFLWGLRSGRVWPTIGAAAMFGYATLTRPFSFLCIPICGLAIVWYGVQHGRPWLRSLLCFAAASILVLAPWVYRNDIELHHPVLFTTNGGSTFYGSNNDRSLHEKAYLGGWISTTELPHRDLIDATPDEVSHDQMEWKLGEDWVRTHWSSMPLLVTFKLARFFSPDLWSLNRKFVIFQCVTYLPLAALIVWALWRNGRKRAFRGPAWLALHSIIVANLITTVVFWGPARFRDCVASVLVIYAAMVLRGSLLEDPPLNAGPLRPNRG